MILLDPTARPIIAHRGASGEAPENTMLAFELGIALGADAFEFEMVDPILNRKIGHMYKVKVL